MFLLDATIGETLWLSLQGLGIVFIGLIAVMALIFILGATSRIGVKAEADGVIGSADGPTAIVTNAKPVSAAASNKVPAPGSLGELDLHTVDDVTAAMAMAIVADDLKAPLNTLRFTSIREVGKDESK